MPEYRVREGKRHGAFGQYGPGDSVTLTEVEAAGFLDKLERVEAALLVPIPDTIPDTPSTSVRVVFSVVDGISDELQQALYDAGYTTWQDILDAGVVKIKDTVSGVGMQRARALFKKAEFEG